MAKALVVPKLEPVDVAIVTEGTYPYMRGGVSTVIHQIVSGCRERSFGIIFLGWERSRHPTAPVFDLPPNVKWTFPIYLSPEENHLPVAGFLSKRWHPFSGNPAALALQQIHEGLMDMARGESFPFDEIYKRFFDPCRSHLDVWSSLRSPSLMRRITALLAESRFTFSETVWIKRDFFALLHALTRHHFPRAQVYHSHTSGYAGFVAALAASQNDGRFFLTEHALHIRDMIKFFAMPSAYQGIVPRGCGQPTPASPRECFWKHWFLRLGEIVYQQADMVSFLYPAIIDEAVSYGCPRGKACVIPNGVSPERFSAARERQKRRESSRSDLNHVWRIGMVGRVVAIKGILDAIGAMDELRRHFSGRFRLELIGPIDEDPAYVEECRKLVEEKELDDHVRFLGVGNVEEILGEIDVLLLSSQSEAMPMAVLEAMAAEVPVVSTDVGSVRHLLVLDSLSHGLEPAGMVVSRRESSELAAALARVLSDGKLRREWAANGPRRIEKLFRLSDMVARYDGHYVGLMARAAKENAHEYESTWINDSASRPIALASRGM